AGTTGMLDLTSRDWRPALLDMAGLRADILSPVKETGSVLGRVTEQAAQESGLLRGTPVVMGGGDVQLGSLGLGIVRAGQTAVLGGTFWQQIVNLPEPAIDPEMNIRINPHVIPGMAQAESISFFTGLTMRWFRDAFCAEEKLLAERLGVDAYSLLEEMAARVPPGAYGVMPIFSDAMHFKPGITRRRRSSTCRSTRSAATNRRCFARWRRMPPSSPPAIWNRSPPSPACRPVRWCSPAAGPRASCGAKSSATSPG
ncbi:hypothetical protein AK51_03175, partial [Serratia nematodiphila DZ0503SBS1]